MFFFTWTQFACTEPQNSECVRLMTSEVDQLRSMTSEGGQLRSMTSEGGQLRLMTSLMFSTGGESR
jgi:hypothetical protein